MTETLLTIKDASKYLRVHPNTIRNLLKKGELEAHRLGPRLIRIHTTDLQKLLTTYTRNEKNV